MTLEAAEEDPYVAFLSSLSCPLGFISSPLPRRFAGDSLLLLSLVKPTELWVRQLELSPSSVQKPLNTG